ncbi:hypothetical protein EYF80_014480 [Liparis tanakae]|uniref:Uncharacterized protein n=1 Tax=Liparis tanakae TaxID=230148 RepID=A0A4Z2IE14_9TELE|nr:hypothetical protein EYF80_014480 [Liparis tanakae]
MEHRMVERELKSFSSSPCLSVTERHTTAASVDNGSSQTSSSSLSCVVACSVIHIHGSSSLIFFSGTDMSSGGVWASKENAGYSSRVQGKLLGVMTSVTIWWPVLRLRQQLQCPQLMLLWHGSHVPHLLRFFFSLFWGFRVFQESKQAPSGPKDPGRTEGLHSPYPVSDSVSKEKED